MPKTTAGTFLVEKTELEIKGEIEIRINDQETMVLILISYILYQTTTFEILIIVIQTLQQ